MASSVSSESLDQLRHVVGRYPRMHGYYLLNVWRIAREHPVSFPRMISRTWSASSSRRIASLLSTVLAAARPAPSACATASCTSSAVPAPTSLKIHACDLNLGEDEVGRDILLYIPGATPEKWGYFSDLRRQVVPTISPRKGRG